MAKTPKSKPVPSPDPAQVTHAADASALPPQDAPAALAELTADALKARADEWDAAREALKAAGDAAATAQGAFDALPKDASDEQRQDALDALAAAESAVKTAQSVIEKLSLPEAFGIPGTNDDAIVVPTEAGLAVTIEPGAAYAPVTEAEAPSPAMTRVRVTARQPSRWRGNLNWTPEPKEIDADEWLLSELQGDPVLVVELLETSD